MIERYEDPDMTRVWSDKARRELWYLVERDVARAAGNDLYPDGVGFDLTHRRYQEDPERLAAIEAETRHDFVAWLTHYREQLAAHNRHETARWLHWGLTSSDVIDTALALQVREATWALQERIRTLDYRLGQMAMKYALTQRLGRTHGQAAEPTTLGLRFATWLAALRRIDARLQLAFVDAARVKLSGPVGTYSHLPPSVEDRVALVTNLQPAGPSSQVYMRDSLSAWAFCVGQLVELCEAVALEHRLAAQSEIGEVRWFDEAGSSVMPHKSNPATAENICSLARLARSQVQALSGFALWGDRDLSHSAVERVALPDLCHLAATALRRTEQMVDEARWDTDRLEDNLVKAGDDPLRAAWTLAWIKAGYEVQAAREAAMAGRIPEQLLARANRRSAHRSLLRHVSNVIAQVGIWGGSR